jgi:hypothetical protein
MKRDAESGRRGDAAKLRQAADESSRTIRENGDEEIKILHRRSLIGVS